jgi:hypothetical protein
MSGAILPLPVRLHGVVLSLKNAQGQLYLLQHTLYKPFGKMNVIKDNDPSTELLGEEPFMETEGSLPCL